MYAETKYEIEIWICHWMVILLFNCQLINMHSLLVVRTILYFCTYYYTVLKFIRNTRIMNSFTIVILLFFIPVLSLRERERERLVEDQDLKHLMLNIPVYLISKTYYTPRKRSLGDYIDFTLSVRLSLSVCLTSVDMILSTHVVRNGCIDFSENLFVCLFL